MYVATQFNINLANLNLTRENKSWKDAFILEGKARYWELGVMSIHHVPGLSSIFSKVVFQTTYIKGKIVKINIPKEFKLNL